MRRFLLHVLPSGFHRIRHYGLLANSNRRDNLALARQLRSQSESRKNELGVEGYADVDHPLACRWLAEHGCHTLLHGHTHKPAEHVLDASHQPPLRRLVLGDWEMGGHPVRGDVLRWCPGKDQPWDRVPAVSYATGD